MSFSLSVWKGSLTTPKFILSGLVSARNFSVTPKIGSLGASSTPDQKSTTAALLLLKLGASGASTPLLVDLAVALTRCLDIEENMLVDVCFFFLQRPASQGIENEEEGAVTGRKEVGLNSKTLLFVSLLLVSALNASSRGFFFDLHFLLSLLSLSLSVVYSYQGGDTDPR